ncbi:MAG: DUF5606 domain-containing protein [Bacteroidales bacterium]|nr:DUF5606 domain-containing protein [Bacteroidales bacterium]
MLKDILAISGKPGLFKFLSQGRNGVIVESLEDGKRMNAFASAKVSSLEDIAIYTVEKEVPLAEIFKKISEKENGGECLSSKSSNDEMKKYFLQVLPDYDQERVYVSDIKKVLHWYNLLHKYDMLKFDEEEKDKEEEKKETKNKDTAKASAEKKSDKKPATAKKTTATAGKKAVAPKQPAKKTTPKAPAKKGGDK